jgi:hypothetical protein
MKKIIILIFLTVCTAPVFAQFQQVDYRYAPQWHVSCIGLPDDTCKTQIGYLSYRKQKKTAGQLLACYAAVRWIRFPSTEVADC